MATLATEIQTRYPPQLLINLSNAFGSGTTLNTAYLALLDTDTQRFMRIYANVNFDPNNADHVATGCSAMFLLMQIYTGAVDLDKFSSMFVPMLESLRKISSRDIVAPTTDSTLVASVPAAGQRPWSDPARLAPGTIDAPRSGNSPWVSDRGRNE